MPADLPRFLEKMRVAVLYIALAACSPSPDHERAGHARVSGETERVALPATSGGASRKGAIDDPRMHLSPDEGTLTIGEVKTAAGTEASAIIRITPGPGYHVSVDIPTSLTLAPSDGVTIAKSRLEAGRGEKRDADEFSERSMSFVVKATAAKPGTYAITGTFSFGVCRNDSCHSKKQPITIAVTAS